LNVLFVTATRIGDAVLSSGVIAVLADRYPEARFSVACGTPAAPLFETVPNLDRLIVMDKMPLHAHWLRLWGSVAATRWDIVCDLRGSALSRFLWAGNRIIGTHRDESVHRVEELGRLTNIYPPPEPRIWLSDEDRATAQSLVPDTEPVIAIGPTANWGGKQWPAESFVSLAKRLMAADELLPGARIAVFGAESERNMARPILDDLPADRLLDLIGQPLRIGAACIERASFYLGNDSGLMHVAAAVGTPTLGLFGPSSEIRYGPWGDHCASVRTPEGFKDIVLADDFDHHSQRSLMASLAVDAVYTEVEKLYVRIKDISKRGSE